MSAVDIVMLIGILLGINYAGLFAAAYLVDNRMGSLKYYLIAAALIMMSALFNAVGSSLGSDVAVFIRHTLDCIAAVVISVGLSRALETPVPRRYFAILTVAGLIGFVATFPLPQHDLAKSMTVSLIKCAFVLALVYQAIRNRSKGPVHAILAAGLGVFAFQYLLHPASAYYLQVYSSFDPTMIGEYYTQIDSVLCLVGVFSMSSAIVLQTTYEAVGKHRSASVTDYLTGLLNRRGFFEKGEALSAFPAALVLLDLDHFKQINDRYGHDVGDKVLVTMGRILGKAASDHCIVGRIGGEEFAVIIPRTTLDLARLFAKNLRQAIERHDFHGEQPGLAVTSSLGVTMFDAGGLDAALNHADEALYQAKENGRNQIQVAEYRAKNFRASSGN